jgi:hypothetical protein
LLKEPLGADLRKCLFISLWKGVFCPIDLDSHSPIPPASDSSKSIMKAVDPSLIVSFFFAGAPCFIVQNHVYSLSLEQ